MHWYMIMKGAWSLEAYHKIEYYVDLNLRVNHWTDKNESFLHVDAKERLNWVDAHDQRLCWGKYHIVVVLLNIGLSSKYYIDTCIW